MKTKSTLAAMAALALTSILAVNAQAGNCELPNGASIDGNYIPSSMVSESRANTRNTMVVNVTKKGCDLFVKSTMVDTYVTYLETGKLKTSTRTTSGGTWKFDLRGEKKAVIPKEYIKANSDDAKSAAMTKSLEVYSKLQDDGSIDLKMLFDFEHAGATVRVSGESAMGFSTGGTISFGNDPRKFTGVMAIGGQGIKFRIVPTSKSAEEAGARNLVISSGVNWLLEALEPQINNALRVWELYFVRK